MVPVVNPLSRNKDDAAIADALRRLFPGRRRTHRLCAAFERSETSMEQIMAGKNVPRDVRLIVGLLVSCPVEFWPLRWQEARGTPGANKPTVEITTVVLAQ